MIGSLRGRLASKQPPQVILECGGVGYEIETPMSTFLELPSPGTEVFLHTHLLVREDAQTLYGFSTPEEKRLFRTLLKVSGVGARMALAILSSMTVTAFQHCVQHEDSATLVKVPGIGKKTAERLIVEMRDRIDGDGGVPAKGRRLSVPGQDSRTEAFDALVALGYKPREAERLLAGLESEGMSSEDMIRSALRQMAG